MRGGVVISGAGVQAGVHGGDEGASPYGFFRVADLDVAIAKLRELGGATVPLGDEDHGDEQEAARFGRFVWCHDEQRSGFGLHEPPDPDHDKGDPMTGELSFFELGVADIPRAQAFYGALFGWQFEQVRDGFVISGAGLGGGIHGGDEGASPYVFFAVEDMDAAVAQVKELGGAADPVGGEGADDEKLVSQHGRFMLCRDDQGSSFGLHEPPAR